MRLSRKHLYLLGIITILAFGGISFLNKVLESSITNGKIVANGYFVGKKGSTSQLHSLVEFNIRGEKIQFLGKQLSYEVGQDVKIIYPKENPQKAEIFSFLETYFPILVFSVLPLILWTAFVYSYFNKDTNIILRFWKRKE